MFILRRNIDATISWLQESPGPRRVSILAHFSEMSTGAFCPLTMSRSITPATAYPASLAGNGDVCQRRTEHKAPGVSPPLSRAGPTLLLCQKQPVGGERVESQKPEPTPSTGASFHLTALRFPSNPFIHSFILDKTCLIFRVSQECGLMGSLSPRLCGLEEPLSSPHYHGTTV